jgi:hypothetical protein
MPKLCHLAPKLVGVPKQVIKFINFVMTSFRGKTVFSKTNFFLISGLITFKISYISKKSAERMKSYNIFPKSIFAKSPNFAPLQFRNRGAFWETKNIFGKHYPNTLKNAQKKPILKQFFLSDRLSMDCT